MTLAAVRPFPRPKYGSGHVAILVLIGAQGRADLVNQAVKSRTISPSSKKRWVSRIRQIMTVISLMVSCIVSLISADTLSYVGYFGSVLVMGRARSIMDSQTKLTSDRTVYRQWNVVSSASRMFVNAVNEINR
jgi:hypothetical protein